MRRKDREVTDINEICGILNRAEVLRIAMNNGKYPYILPVNFGFLIENGDLILFFHTSKYGLKHEIIGKDNHISFETDCGHRLLPPKGEEACGASFEYESVIGCGIISKCENSEKEELLKLLTEHYGIKNHKFNPQYMEETVIYKIRTEFYTAKRNGK